MARLYILNGDYQYGVTIYNEIVADNPGTEAADAAVDGISYLYANLIGTQIVARQDRDLLMAMRCGPTALQYLLAMRDIDRRVRRFGRVVEHANSILRDIE